jgi:hypothetical protein
MTGYPDPFRDLATAAMPYSAPAMFRYAEHFAVSQETFREALRRIACFFITDIVLDGDAEREEKKNYKDYLKNDAAIESFLLKAGCSTLVYGNSYSSALRPFTRWLQCPGKTDKSCSARYRFETFANDPRYNFTWNNGFCGRCPACGFQGDFGRPWDVDDPSRPVIFKVWNPYDIRPHYDDYTGETVAFDWVIPADYRNDIRRGDPVTLSRAPWPVLKAVINNEDFRFAEGFVHHWRDEFLLAGVRTRGLGIPLGLLNFRILYYLQILRRYNEALGASGVVPFRVVSPLPAGRETEGGDPIRVASMYNLQARFMKMLAQHIRDPGSWHFSPVPLNSQSLGADAKQYAPKDLLDQGYNTLLNGTGVPVEFYNLSLNTTTAPVGLRLMRRFHSPFVGGLNRLTGFAVNKVVAYRKWESVKGRLEENDLVDLIENQQLRAQMVSAGWMAKGQALRMVGTDSVEQTREILDEQIMEAREKAKAQEKLDAMGLAQQVSLTTNPAANLQQQQAAGAPPAPGGGPPGTPPPGGAGAGPAGVPDAGAAPGQPGQQPSGLGDVYNLVPTPGQPVDPVDLQQRAQAAAQVLLSPEVTQSQRTSVLNQLKKQHQTFHGAVRMAIENLRTQASSAGRDQALAQMTAR